jgi:hypothetical protein
MGVKTPEPLSTKLVAIEDKKILNRWTEALVNSTIRKNSMPINEADTCRKYVEPKLYAEGNVERGPSRGASRPAGA